MRKRIKFSIIGLTVALVAGLVIALMPAGVSITDEGFLSLSTNVVLAVGSPPSDEVTRQSSQIEREWIELDWMRTKNSKVFHSYEIPNRESHDIYLDAVHYEVGYSREIVEIEGPEIIYWTTWEDIDNTLEPATAPWDWQMVKADYNIYILEDFTYGQILKFEKADPYGLVLGDVAFQPMALQWTNDLDQIQQVSMPQTGTLSVTGSKIEWTDAYGPNIDFSWTSYSTRLVKLLTVSSLSDLPTPEQYILDGGNPVLELNLIFDSSSELDIYIDGIIWAPNKPTSDTFGIVEFKLDGETLWGFMPLRVWDSSGEDEVSVIQRLRKVGNKLYVSMRVPYDWIENATYPIYIDAVIDEWVETSSDDAHEIVSDGSMDLTDTIIDLGSYTGGPTHAGFRFTSIDTTDVENVSTAYLEFYPAQGDSGAVNYTWYGEDVASASTFTTTAYDISSRDRTTASVTENSPVSWTSGVPVQTTDLSDILNEIFSRGDWVSGNDLAILNIYNSGSGERRLRSWDYNDHSKAPKLHFENPTEVTYYFNSKSSSNWTDSAYMIDGLLTNFASTSTDEAQEILNGNTCPGTDLGTITKVELRGYGWGDGNDEIDLKISPSHAVAMPSSEGWSAYVDVTADSSWTWANIATTTVYARYNKVGQGNTMYVAKVEIRVTYTAPFVPPVSDIDVGADPIDRDSWSGSGYTQVDKNNPATASGTLHSVKIWAVADITGLRVGTFYVVSGDTLKCRDSVLIGDVAAGSEQTFTGLSITVEIGDFLGSYWTGGELEVSLSGFDGRWRKTGEYIDPDDQADYFLYPENAMSLYGYGDFVDGADISNAPSSKSFGVVSPSSTNWSNGSEPSWPLVDADAYFTVTNNSSGSVSIAYKATNFTGGDGWNLTTGSPGSGTVRMSVFIEGDGSGDGDALTTGDQTLIPNLGASSDTDWELKLETGTFTDGAGKTSTITLTATLL